VAAESDHRRIDASAEDQRLRDAVEYACDFTPLSRRWRPRRTVATSRSAGKFCAARRHRPQPRWGHWPSSPTRLWRVSSACDPQFGGTQGERLDFAVRVPPRELEMSPPAPLRLHALEGIGVPANECGERRCALRTQASVPGRSRPTSWNFARASRGGNRAPDLARSDAPSAAGSNQSYGHLTDSLLRCCEGGRTICPR